MDFEPVVMVLGQVAVAAITGVCLVKVAQLKQHVNSRMDELLKLTRKQAYSNGKLAAIEEASESKEKSE